MLGEFVRSIGSDWWAKFWQIIDVDFWTEQKYISFMLCYYRGFWNYDLFVNVDVLS